MIQSDLDKVIITGAAGRIGRVFSSGIRLPKSELDVCSPASIDAAFSKYSPTAVIHLAATNLRDAEADPRAAFNLNIIGSRNLAERTAACRIPLVFFSSGAVFNGPLNAVFDETSTPNPRNIYGWSKYLAELLLQKIEENLLIIRTGWVFGPPTGTRPDFIQSMSDSACRGGTINATTDQRGNPTAAEDLVAETYRLLTEDRRGIVHVANSGAATAYEVAQQICGFFSSKSVIVPASIETSDSTGPSRSASETIESKYVRLRSWSAALDEYLKNFQTRKDQS